MKKEQAFTLVEILVVIAIIGILASLAVPGLNSALEKARRTESQAKLKNIGIMLHSYALDNNQNFPMVPKEEIPFNANEQADDGAASWMMQLIPYLSGCPEGHTGTSAVLCVAEKAFSSKYVARINPAGGEQWSYFFGSHAAGFAEGELAPLNLRRIRYPSRHILGGEVLSGGSRDDSNKNDYDGSPAFALNKRGVMTNVLFVDGHVAVYPTTITSGNVKPSEIFSVTYGGPDDPSPSYFGAQ